jgi:CS domain/N-terminal conserved domain of Nudc.
VTSRSFPTNHDFDSDNKMSASSSIDDDRFDGLYLNVAQTARGIDPLLHTLFSFLRRRTDFFNEKGTDVAVAKVNEILQCHVALYKKEEEEKQEKKKLKQKKPKTASSVSNSLPLQDVVEIGKDGTFDVSSSEQQGQDKSNATVSSSTPDDANDSKDGKNVTPPTTSAPDPVVDKSQEDDEAGEDAKVKVPPPLGNGGTVPGKYVWTQTLSEVNVNVFVPENTRGRDLNVVIARNHLSVALRSAPKGTFVVNAPLTKAVVVDDSFWTVEDGNRLCLNLQKVNTMEWWEGVCVGDPAIDVKTIQPESSSLSDLDGETRTTVEKMMYDQKQRALGKPTSEEEKKMEIFENFKKQHPELDFSQAKIT